MRGLLVAAALLLAVSPLRAQTVDPELEKAIQARDAAIRAGDAETWSRYTMDDFVMVRPDGVVVTKAQRMMYIKTGKVDPVKPSSKVEMRVYGDTVIETWRPERPDYGPSQMVSVWVKQGGQWKVAHLQFTPIVKK